jgi:hypothetical protein
MTWKSLTKGSVAYRWHRDDALASYQAEFVILDRLAKSDPGNADWQRDLAMSHIIFAATYKNRGKAYSDKSGPRSRHR